MPSRVEWHARTAADLAVPASLADRTQPVTGTQGAQFGYYLGGSINRIGARPSRAGATGSTQPVAAPLG